MNESAVKIETNSKDFLGFNFKAKNRRGTSKSYAIFIHKENCIPARIIKCNEDICLKYVLIITSHCISNVIFTTNKLKLADVTPTNLFQKTRFIRK